MWDPGGLAKLSRQTSVNILFHFALATAITIAYLAKNVHRHLYLNVFIFKRRLVPLCTTLVQTRSRVLSG